MVVMTENSRGRSIRPTWRALRHERRMSRPARRDRRVQLEACDQGVSQQRDLVRPKSMVLDRLNILADISTRQSKALSCLTPMLCLDPIVVQTALLQKSLSLSMLGGDWPTGTIKNFKWSQFQGDEL